MTDKLKDAAEMALKALQEYTDVVATAHDADNWHQVIDGGKPAREATQALRQALAEWKPDDTAYRPDGLSMPVDRGAWSDVPDATKWVDELRGDEPKREWQWLTEEDIHDLFMSNETVDDFGDFETIACAVSTKLKGKNNG